MRRRLSNLIAFDIRLMYGSRLRKMWHSGRPATIRRIDLELHLIVRKFRGQITSQTWDGFFAVTACNATFAADWRNTWPRARNLQLLNISGLLEQKPSETHSDDGAIRSKFRHIGVVRITDCSRFRALCALNEAARSVCKP